MPQRTINFFTVELRSKAPKMIYNTKKVDVYHIADTGSLDIIDLKDYGPKKQIIDRFQL